MAQLMPLPSISLAAVNPDWFYLSDAGSPGWSQIKSKGAIKQLWVCGCVKYKYAQNVCNILKVN